MPLASPTTNGLVSPDMYSFDRILLDANECVTSGSYRMDPNVLNLPSNINYGDVMFVIVWDPNTIHQFIYTLSGLTFKRIKSSGWKSWVQI